MKFKRFMFKTSLKEEASLNVVPLIDIIFTILIFFLLIYGLSTFAISEVESEDITIPKAKLSTTFELDKTIFIEIKKGSIYVSKKLVQLNEIPYLIKNKGKPEELSCAIISDKETTYDIFTPLILKIKESGVK